MEPFQTQNTLLSRKEQNKENAGGQQKLGLIYQICFFIWIFKAVFSRVQICSKSFTDSLSQEEVVIEGRKR